MDYCSASSPRSGFVNSEKGLTGVAMNHTAVYQCEAAHSFGGVALSLREFRRKCAPFDINKGVLTGSDPGDCLRFKLFTLQDSFWIFSI